MNRGRLKGTLIRHEGLVLKPYEDSLGIKTIGIGRNLESRGITQHEAEHLLDNDLELCERELRQNFDFFEKLSDTRQEVLMNMCFQLGYTRLSGFKRMIHALSQNDFYIAAEEMLDSKWAIQTPTRADELSTVMARNKWGD